MAKLTQVVAKKPRVGQVLTQNFIEDQCILELVYDLKVRGCKTRGHTNKTFDKLYAIPCKKTLEWQYFKNIFIDSSSRVNMEINKQQIYIHYCHKLCQECVQNFCYICEPAREPNFGMHTKFLFDTSIIIDIEIGRLEDFHQTFHGLGKFFKKKSEEKRNKKKQTPYNILQCSFVRKGLLELSILEAFNIKIDMQVTISYSNIPQNVKNKDEPY